MPKREDILKLLEAMRPKPSPAPLIRIGPDRDGAYLLPDDLKGVSACFSPGVSNSKDFEDQLAMEYGIASHLCDASTDVDRLRTPLIDGLQTFEKLWLDVTGAEDTISLDDWVARHRSDPGEDLILQMDIEGAEYRNVLHTSDNTLKRFRIIVVELHSLHMIRNENGLSNVLLPFFERLDRYFTCVHAHPNNVSGSPKDMAKIGITIPNLVELTFIRNDRFEDRSLHDVQLPHPHDLRLNVSNKPPVFLDDFFRGRPPSEREMRRMFEDLSDWCSRELERLIFPKTIAVKDLVLGFAELRKENERLIRDLQKLRMSNSWRLTAPLRRICSIVRSQKT
jgi:hypothetical protein